jgi:hypothetical protein
MEHLTWRLEGDVRENESIIDGRRIARVRNGLALVPASTISRDHIYFIQGCEVPFVCRQIDLEARGAIAILDLEERILDEAQRSLGCWGTQTHVKLVGECFFQGFMYGAINNPHSKSNRWLMAIHQTS